MATYECSLALAMRLALYLFSHRYPRRPRIPYAHPRQLQHGLGYVAAARWPGRYQSQ